MKKLVVFLILVLSFLNGYCIKDTCRVGVYVKNIYDLQPNDFSYAADFYMWLSHKDNYKKFDDVEIVNSKQFEKFQDSYEKDSSDFISYENCKAKMHHNWDLTRYPFDKQTIHIRIENGYDTTKTILICDADGFVIDDKIKINGWKITNHYKTDTFHVYHSDFGYHKTYKNRSAYSVVYYSIDIQRDSWGLFFKLLSGLYIAFAVSTLSLFIRANHIDPRFGLGIGGLFAAVANKYVVDSNIPMSSGSTFVDSLHIYTFIFILASLIASVVSLFFYEKGKQVISLKIDITCRWVLIGLYLLLNVYLLIKII